MQIGDWIFQYDGYDSEGSLNSPIRAIGEQYGGDAIFLELCGSDPFHARDFLPIKISSVILERNGFKKEEWTTNSWILVEGGIKADIGECDEGWFLRIKDIKINWFCLLKTIKYVHELQQCFRLFGLRKSWNDWEIENEDDCDWSLLREE